MKLYHFLALILVMALISISPDIFAQGCSQCRMVPASDISSGNGIGRGLNSGILYLLGIVYIFAGVIAFVFRKNLKELFNRLRTRNY